MPDSIKEINPSIELRPVTAHDRDFLVSLYGMTRSAELALLPWAPEQKTAFIEMQFKAQQLHYSTSYPSAEHQIILANGQPAGQIHVNQSNQEVHLIDIIIAPQFQGRGIGTALLKDLQLKASQKGIPMRLYAYKFNQPALEWYLRMNFSILEDTGMYLFLEWQPEHQGDR